MDTILIATDFSAAGRNATQYGFQLSKWMNAKVILFNAYHIPASHPDSLVYVSTNDQEELSYRQLVEEAENLDPNRAIALETRSCPGPVLNAILSVAEETNASLIIVGMKAHGREIRKFFGSTVTWLQNRSFIPVIVVPEKVQFSIPKTIALGSENAPYADIHILDPLKKFAKIFDSKLFIVRVIEKNMSPEFAERMIPTRLERFFADMDASFVFRKGDDVARAINNFVKEASVNMIAVMPHEHDFLSRLFIRSFTKEIVFQTTVPLLILPDQNRLKAQIGTSIAFEGQVNST